MNKKILIQYLKMIIVSIIMVLGIWLLLCYFILFADKTVDENLPQYMILSIEDEIKFYEDDIEVQESLIKRLRDGNVWMQILDIDGKCIYEYNVPTEIPREYKNFELVELCMKSDQILGYTLYFKELKKIGDYGIILGCDSGKVSKVSYSYEGNGKDEIVEIIILLFLTAVVVILISAFLFSRKISQPVTAIIEGISEVEHGKYKKKKYKSNIFGNVFEKLERLDFSLKENDRMREEWIANISHDLKTPLSTIKGYAEIMQNDEYSFSENEVRMYSGEILKAEQNMDSLVNDLKISQKLKEGKILLKKEKVNLTELINECINEVDVNILKESDITFEQEEEILVYCDRSLIKRSLQNIIHNSFIHNQKDIHLHIKLDIVNKRVVIRISDDGKGMSKDEMSHIFERYYRGTSSQKSKGTGLGLAIAKEVVCAHGGNIMVDSKEGKGTEFYIEI